MLRTEGRAGSRSVQRVRAGALALACAGLAVAACTVDATGVAVTLDMAGIQATRIMVAITDDRHASLGMGGLYTAHPVPNTATFGVQLADALDGRQVQLRVDAFDDAQRHVGCGTGFAQVMKHKAAQVVITMMAGCDQVDHGDMAMPPTDGGADLATPDLAKGDTAAPPDLAITDGAVPPDGPAPPDLGATLDIAQEPDLATGDIAMGADMANRCGTCANGVAVTCCNGMPTSFTCAAQCDGKTNACLVPSCQSPLDVSAGGVFMTNSTGGPDNLTSACSGGMSGPEAVFSFKLTDYTNVQLDVATTAAPVVYARQSCAMGPELVAGGQCNMSAQAPACISGVQNPQQVLCGLPAGTYYAIVDSSTCGGGGAIKLTSTFTRATQDDCATAGLAPGPYPQTITGDTRPKMMSHSQAPMNQPTCGVDKGATAPELVYYIPAPVAKLNNGYLRARITAKSMGFLPLIYIQQYCIPASTLCSDGKGMMGGLPLIDFKNPGVGPYYIFVDGDQGTTGSFTLVVDWGP